MISILITAYNREKFIAEAIESILASTHKDFELIIVDDRSTDNTMAIAMAYSQKDERIRVHRNEKNLGDYPNRNRAASLATGKYLKFVDSDDRIYPGTLSTMVNMMEKFPAAGLGLSDVVSSQDEAYPTLLETRAAYLFHYFKRPISFASPGLAIFRKDAFDAVGGFLERRMTSDFEMWHKMALYSPVVLMPGNLYWSRKHKDQELADQHKYIVEYEKIKIKYLFADQAPLTKNEAFGIVKQRKATLLKIFLRKLLVLELKAALLRIKIYFFYLREFKRLKTHS